MKLNLTKPLALIDLETTGVNVGVDRIIEISILKVMPDGSKQTKTRRVHPGIPIPAESTAIHGISDEDVKEEPPFERLAKGLANFLEDSDLGGFNAIKFDIPVLMEEFLRVGVDFSLKNRKLVDVQNIFHLMEQRTLVAAYKFYCNQNLEQAHSAEADILATYEVLLAQIERYADTPFTDKKGEVSYPVKNDMASLAKFSNLNHFVDLAGRIILDESGAEVFNFGKYKGKKVIDIFRTDPSYYAWMMNGDFPQYTKKVITEIKLRDFSR